MNEREMYLSYLAEASSAEQEALEELREEVTPYAQPLSRRVEVFAKDEWWPVGEVSADWAALAALRDRIKASGWQARIVAAAPRPLPQPPTCLEARCGAQVDTAGALCSACRIIRTETNQRIRARWPNAEGLSLGVEV